MVKSKKQPIKAHFHFVRHYIGGDDPFTVMTVRFSAPETHWLEDTVNELYLRDLVVRAQVSSSKDRDLSEYYGFEFMYMDKHSADLRETERMVKTLRKLYRKVTTLKEKAYNAVGYDLPKIMELGILLDAVEVSTWEIWARDPDFSEYSIEELARRLPTVLANADERMFTRA